MASKQALRDFQSRLAQRLQSARESGAAASWLAVELGGERFLFPLSHAGEIFSITDIQAVPYVRPWFMGVANLRGGLSGVVDMAFFLRDESHQRSDNELAQCRLVALNPLLDTNCAMLVDRLVGLRTVEAFASSAPAAQEAPAYFGHVHTDLEGRAWQELNLQALSRHPDFLNIST